MRGGGLMEREELQQISQMRELYHQKIAQIEEQISKLDQVINEHEITNRSVKQLVKGDTKEGLIPIGAGVQIPIQYIEIESTLIDIGSGIHAEKSLEETSKLLEIRIGELKELIEQLVTEHATTKQAISELNHKLESTIKSIENTPPKKDQVMPKSKQKKKRRRYGGELTLDD